MYAETERELAAVFELDECLQHLRVHFLGRLVGAHVLAAERLPDADDATRKATIAERIGGHICRLADGNACDVRFIHINTDAANPVVCECDDRRVE